MQLHFMLLFSLRGLYLVNELATMAEVFKGTQQHIEGCFGFVFSEEL